MSPQDPPPNCAIHFHPEAFSLGRKIMGRMAAGQGFLNGFLRHARVDRFYCYAKTPAHFAAFREAVRAARRSGRGPDLNAA